MSDWLRPAFPPAEYFWKNAYETRSGATGPPLATLSPPRVRVRAEVRVGVRLGLGVRVRVRVRVRVGFGPTSKIEIE